LDLSKAELSPKARVNSAWSCNVGFYISIFDELVDVIRWDEPEKTERYTIRSVAENLSGFYHYLERHNPEWNKGIVNFYGNAFRRLRSNFAPEAGRDALQAFLYILACALENQVELGEEALRSWSLPESAREFASKLDPANFMAALDQISGIGAYESLTPDMPLVFRHASGMIFQDAHRTATLSPQGFLPGLAPEAVLRPLPMTAIGVHFTPPTIARTLAEEAVLALDTSRPELIILDPACGSAELLKEIVRILERRKYSGTLRLRAFDISPTAVDMARFSLAFEKKHAKTFAINFVVEAADALTEPWPAADLIIMNPPFRRWNDLSIGQHAILASLLGGKASRHNLATAFLAKASDSLAPRGVVAAIAPKAFFESDAARDVRTKVSSMLSPRVIARLGSQDLFRDILVDAGIYVGIKGSDASPAVALWADQTSTSTGYALRALRRRHVQEVLPISEESHSIYSDFTLGRGPQAWAPRRYSAISAIERARDNSKLIPARRCFEIKQGARMGSDVFIVTKDYWQKLGKAERAYFRPAVLNQSIRNGRLSDNYYAFFPHTTGLEKISNEAKLLELVPKYAAQQLIPSKPELLARKSLTDHKRWWEMVRRREWQEAPNAKLVSKYFGGSGSFAWDESGEFVVVVGHAWLPRRSELKTNAAFGRLIEIYLNLPETEDLIDALSVRVSGGQLDLSWKYLRDLPVPNIDKVKLDVAYFASISDPLDESARERVRRLLGLVQQ